MIPIRPVEGPAAISAVENLYRDVFGGSLNRRLLVGIASNGGHLLGAYDGDRLIGYGLSFLARADGRLYQYSQTVGVVPDAQGRGVGRAIKYAQRDAARADGIDLIRWSFDPLHARNAHFNTDVLGGRIRRFHKDFYGEGTDRFVVDWELDPTPATVDWDVPTLAPGQSTEVDSGLAIGIPAMPGTDAHASAQLGAALDRGLVGASCRRLDEHTAVYLFVPA